MKRSLDWHNPRCFDDWAGLRPGWPSAQTIRQGSTTVHPDRCSAWIHALHWYASALRYWFWILITFGLVWAWPSWYLLKPSLAPNPPRLRWPGRGPSSLLRQTQLSGVDLASALSPGWLIDMALYALPTSRPGQPPAMPWAEVSMAAPAWTPGAAGRDAGRRRAGLDWTRWAGPADERGRLGLDLTSIISSDGLL